MEIELSSSNLRHDAELLALGKQLNPLHTAFWSAIDRYEAGVVNDHDAGQLLEAMQPVLRAISALPAHTEAGRRVKLRAWAHCQDCEEDELSNRLKGGAQEALTASIFIDQLRELGVTLRPQRQPQDRGVEQA